jgi:RNA polymerase sigma factor (TIGR02999 family)
LSRISVATPILSAIEQGHPRTAERLLALVYDELRKMAANRLAREKLGQTLQATALVHEAYLRLMASDHPQLDSRGLFFAAAAEAMRRILVEHARRKATRKHGGKLTRRALDPALIAHPERAEELVTLDKALERLKAVDPVVAALLQLRFFAGMSIPQAASALGVCPRTADGYWSYAKAWLLEELRK